MDKGKLPKSDTRRGAGARPRTVAAKSGDETVRLRVETPRPQRRRDNVIEVDPTIPDAPLQPRESTVGIRSTSGRGGNRKVKDVNEKAAELVGPHSTLPEVMPFDSTLAFAYRHIGGVPAAIEAARLVSEKDERFKRVVYAYDETADSARSKLRLEALCAAAEIPAEEFLGATIAALYSRNVEIGKLIAAANHPKVVEATIEHAQKVNGFMDRKMMHDHMAFLPQPKGMTIINDNSRKTLNTGATGGQVTGVQDTSKVALPSFEADTMDGIAAIRGDAGVGSVGQKRLPAPKPEQDVILPGDVEENVQPS